MINKKKIAITMGDPSGIGPEIIVKSLSGESFDNFIPIVINLIFVNKFSHDWRD